MERTTYPCDEPGCEKLAKVWIIVLKKSALREQVINKFGRPYVRLCHQHADEHGGEFTQA